MNAARAAATGFVSPPRAEAIAGTRPWVARPVNTLTAWLRDHTLSPEAAIGVAVGVAAEVRKLHDQARTHGQIDPDHIVVTPAGAELLPPRPDLDNLPVTAYTAPELIRGDGPGPMSDLYSLGAVIYTLCSGRKPYASVSPDELREEILTFPPDPLFSNVTLTSLRNARFYRGVELLVSSCLERTPGRRPHRIQRVQHELDALMAMAGEAAFRAPAREPEPAPVEVQPRFRTGRPAATIEVEPEFLREAAFARVEVEPETPRPVPPAPIPQEVEYRPDPGLTRRVAAPPRRSTAGLLPMACPRCRSPWVYESKARSRFETFALYLGVDLCRCHQCFHRFMDFGWFKTAKASPKGSRSAASVRA